MATLRDTALSCPAALEVAPKPFCGRHARGPAQERFELRVGIAAALPVRVPRPAIKDGRQLAFGPRGVFLPSGAQQIADQARDGDGPEGSDVSLVEAQELSTRGEVVIDHIQDLSVDTLSDASQDDCLGTIVHVREGYDVRASQVQEDPERPGADPARDPRLTRTIHAPGPNEDIRDPVLRPVPDNELILFNLRVAIGLAAALGVRLDRTRLVQKTPVGLVPVR